MSSPESFKNSPSAEVESLLLQIRPLLPIQNPLATFVHNNLLLAFEDRPFHQGAQEAAQLYGARPYCPEGFYREALAQGRIHPAELTARLDSANGTLEAFLNESSKPWRNPSLRLASFWERERREPFSRRIHDILIPLLATVLDQGMSGWPSPLESEGLWTAFGTYLEATPSWTHDWLAHLQRRFSDHQRSELSPEEIIRSELLHAQLPKAEQRLQYCLEILFDLRGWAGMINKLETEPAQAPIRPSQIKLRDYLAVRLVSEHSLDSFLAEKHGLPLEGFRNRNIVWVESRRRTDGLQRLALWHEAYEASYRTETLRKLDRHFKEVRTQPSAPPAPARAQFLFCMDDREESFRRHLEKTAPGYETFGGLGFFSVDMKYQAVHATRATVQCPPVITPTRTITEKAIGGYRLMHADIDQRLTASGRMLLSSYYHSRTLARGFLSSMALGVLSFVPLTAKILFPNFSARLRQRTSGLIFPVPQTELCLDGEEGYSLSEQAQIVESNLRMCGLIQDFSPLVVIVSHGSTNTNNPFRQAYGCGACSGNHGKPNARALVSMANRKEVRDLLKKNGVVIPDSTVFVAAYHDTCSEDFDFLDESEIPAASEPELRRMLEIINKVRLKNAQERCQRFGTFHHRDDPDRCLAHVADRSQDLAQPRPEYGHSRVALCIVGRRELTRGISLDRRAFLASYNPERDPDGSALAQIVSGSVPVAANIALDYYFSRVDNERFGAGSKLPLNVTSLLGVMTGSKSDLRIGLPREMVEIHEPMRILVLIEAEESHLRATVEGNARLLRLVKNGWIHLARIDPKTGEVRGPKEGHLPS